MCALSVQGRKWSTAVLAELLEPRRLFSHISGTLFNDANDNGVKDAGEAGLSGWTVYKDNNNNGNKDTGEPTVVTPSSGFYCFNFNGSVASCHYIRVVGQSGWRMTLPTTGAVSVYIPNDASYADNQNFGLTQKARATGTAFNDTFPDGVKQSNESGISGRSVYVDVNDNGVKDTGEPSATTASSGAFDIRNITAGSYKVRLAPRTGYSYTAPADFDTYGEYLSAPLSAGDNIDVGVFAEVRALIPPKDLTATRNSSTQVTLSWIDTTENESGFKVELSSDDGATFTQIATVSAAVGVESSVTYIASGSDASGCPVYRVAAYDANGNSPYSNYANPDGPVPPTNFVSTASKGSVTLSWTATSGVVYDLYRTTVPSGSAIPARVPSSSPYKTALTGGSYTDTAVTNGTQYYYQLRPRVPCGSSYTSVPLTNLPGITATPPPTLGKVAVTKYFLAGAFAHAATFDVNTTGMAHSAVSHSVPQNSFPGPGTFVQTLETYVDWLGIYDWETNASPGWVDATAWLDGSQLFHHSKTGRPPNSVGGKFMLWGRAPNAGFDSPDVGSHDLDASTQVNAYACSPAPALLLGAHTSIFGGVQGFYTAIYEYTTPSKDAGTRIRPPTATPPSLFASSKSLIIDDEDKLENAFI